jgi:Ca-activated chloride channel family protein
MSVRIRSLAVSLAALVAAAATPVFAQTTPPEDDGSDVDVVVVTGSRIRQGGAQDINHFRGEAQAERIPMPGTLTPEGLMGDYDIQIPGAAPCRQTFCLTADAMRASILTRPDDRLLVGLGMSSNIDDKTWSRPALNLVAVVDKSGSMSGEPLQRVRESLLQILGQLRPGDQLSIVLYGDRSHVYLEPTRLTAANRAEIAASIRGIQSAGSTNMEAGLKLGYDTAFASAPGFAGTTRVMLFTDEQPNVGRTDAESFMAMAEEASRRHVGLTTIGVGVQYDAALGTRIASVRGGNLFFLRDKADVKTVFSEQLDTMVSEVAYDVVMAMTPAPGWRISAVYGVPGDMLERTEGEGVRFVVPTAFLSTRGGAVFVTLAKAEAGQFLPEPALAPDAALLTGSLTYVSAADGRPASDRIVVAAPSGRPSDGLKLGHALIDEFLGLKLATSLYHEKNDTEGAYQTFRQLAGRLDQAGDPRLAPERKLVDGLLAQTAFLSGHMGEPPKGMETLGLIGTWEVVRVDGRSGRPDQDWRRGDRIVLSADNELTLQRRGKAPDSDAGMGWESWQANKDQLMLEDSSRMFDYEVSGRTLTLAQGESGPLITLRRAAGAQ